MLKKVNVIHNVKTEVNDSHNVETKVNGIHNVEKMLYIMLKLK